jgi:hypothetical protein
MIIDAVIPFCTYDRKFIDKTIEGLIPTCRKIYVVYCDRFFDGTPENLAIIDALKKKNENEQCNFIEVKFNPEKDIIWHHNLQRYEGIKKSDADYLLLVDADEVFEPHRLKEWFDAFSENLPTVAKFSNYWYFRSTKYQAKQYEDSPFLVKRSLISHENSFSKRERGIYANLPGVDVSYLVMGLDGLPMCHHYSWARNKEDMLRKVSSWGHANDRDWKSLIEKEFSGDFSGRDFIHGYSYNILESGYVED